MKIVFDSLVFALHKYGGVTTYWNEFLSRFKKDKADLTILMVRAEKYLNEEFVGLASSGMTHIPEKKWPLQVLRNVSPRISALREKFIFHSTYLRASSNPNAVNIVTIHDFTHQYFVKGFKQLLNHHQKKRAIRDSQGIVCISENTLKDLYHFFPEAKSKAVKVIYNGCSSIYDAVPVDAMPGLPASYILFVGARGNYKNFEFVLKVLAKSRYHLVVAGSKLSEEEETSIADFKDRVTVLNNVSDAKLKALYQHAHAFIYPSLYEGFGIPLLEAMNCGCPVIAFNNSCIGEIMGDSPLLMENNDLEKTLDVLTRLENSQYRQSVISAHRDQARKFSWDKAYGEMKAFYKEVLSKA